MESEFYEKLIVTLIEKTSAVSLYENKKNAIADLKDFVDSNYHDLDDLKIKLLYNNCEINFDI